MRLEIRFWLLVDPDAQSDRSRVEMALHRPAGVGEHPEQLCIARERDRRERPDVVLSCDRGKLLEQQRADSSTLLCIRDLERDFGLGGGETVVSRDREDLVTDKGNDCDMILPVEGFQLQMRSRGTGRRREEPEVDRFVAELFEESHQTCAIVGA